MTHDELVSALKKGIVMTGNRLASHEESANLYRRTILSVVELHKPIETYNMNNVHKSWLTCNFCNDEIYPCPTIQAIEKELQ